MHNVTVNNDVWKELRRIKQKHNFKQMGQAVEYLQNHQLLPDVKVNEEDDQVSVEKNSSLLKEKTIKTQSLDPELNESIESKVDRVLKGERYKKVDPVSLKKNSGFIEEKKALNDIYAFLDGKKDE